MPGNAETGLALALYQRLKDPNDGHLDIFVPVRSFPIDRPPDINHLYSAIAFFGVDRGLPLRDRSGQGMKRNPEAKRPIRIFPVASPAEAMPTPEEFLAAAKEFAIEFDTPVMIPTECANAFHIRQLTWEMFVPRRLN